MPVKTACILVDHGSKSPEAHQEFSSLFLQLKEKLSGASLFFSHMEIAEPLFAEQLRELATQGFEKIYVLPLFFFSGKHLLRDIPAIIKSVQSEYSGVSFVLLDAVGRDLNFEHYLQIRLNNLNLE